MNRLFYISILLIAFTVNSFAQPGKYYTSSEKAIKLFESAIVNFRHNLDELAIKDLKKAIKADANFYEAYDLIGQIHLENGKDSLAIIYCQKALNIVPDRNPFTLINISDAYLNMGEFAKAVPKLEMLVKSRDINPALIERGKHKLACAKFGVEALANPVPFDPIKLDGVNTEFENHSPTLTADEQTMIFTVKRPADAASMTNSGFEEDLYISVKENGVWSKSQPVNSPLNTDSNEGASTLVANGSIMIFTACERPKGLGSCDLYFSRRINNSTWTKPINMGKPINSKYWEVQPSISSDGRTLYFVSRKPGGMGPDADPRFGQTTSDIWYTTLDEEGYWTTPKNIGANINTPGNEMSPFIHPDGNTLYFASDGHVGLGDLDLYMVRKGADGQWGKPVNLGYPINTTGRERSLIVGANGEIAYFVSDRNAENEKSSIYTFPVHERIKPIPVNYMKGKVFDEITKKPLRATFELIDLETGELVIESSSSGSTGEFLVCVPTDRDYALNVSSKNYMFYTDNFALKGVTEINDPYTKDIPLKSFGKGSMVLENVFFETGSYSLMQKSRIELDKLVAFMTNNPDLRVEIGGHTDNVGKPEDNVELSLNRAKAVKDYLVKNKIDETRLEFKGYGETQPRTTNDTEEGRAKNRRTEYKILKPAD